MKQITPEQVNQTLAEIQQQSDKRKQLEAFNGFMNGSDRAGEQEAKGASL